MAGASFARPSVLPRRESTASHHFFREDSRSMIVLFLGLGSSHLRPRGMASKGSLAVTVN